MSEMLAYSIHLGSDKNKTKKAREIAKKNPSGTTSFYNNGIQTANRLSEVDKHNLRKYDNDRELIQIVYGTDNLYKDVQNLYLQEFEESRLEYNAKQTRDDRKIDDYFKHISESKLWDLACEMIIELGDMDFWNTKDIDYRYKMTEVYKEQVQDLMKVIPEFKIASAVIHFKEESLSPHLHIIGVPVSDNNKRGMKKQVAKSKIFTKESLTKLQDKMRECCIKSFNKIYNQDYQLKQKEKGRNQDIPAKEMYNYKQFKKEFEKRKEQVSEASKKTALIDTESDVISDLLDNLKVSKIKKKNNIISNEDIAKIKQYSEKVKDANQSVRKVSDINATVKKFESRFSELEDENYSLRYQVELRDNKIFDLKDDLKRQSKSMEKLQEKNAELEEKLQKFKGFWYSVMKFFQNKVCFDKDIKFLEVAKELFRNGVFNSDENEIINNPARKIKPKEDVSVTNNYKIRQKNDKFNGGF